MKVADETNFPFKVGEHVTITIEKNHLIIRRAEHEETS